MASLGMNRTQKSSMADYLQRVKDSLDQLNAKECTRANIRKMATMMEEFNIATGSDYQPVGETWALEMKMYFKSERQTGARMLVNQLKADLAMHAAVLEKTRKEVDALKTELAAAEAELKQCNDELTELEEDDLDDEASEIRALKAEFEAAGDNPKKLEALLKKLFPCKDAYATSLEAANGDVKDAIDSYLDVCEQDIEAGMEAKKKRKREMPACQRCGKESVRAFTSEALSDNEDDAFYCSAACLQTQEEIEEGNMKTRKHLETQCTRCEDMRAGNARLKKELEDRTRELDEMCGLIISKRRRL